jgi:SAM-dependent methyltransferase
MIKTNEIDTPTTLLRDFLEEYNAEESVYKYTKATAGRGISYLLDHDYGDLYLDVFERYIPKSRRNTGLRLFEFGCGGGMNLLHLVSLCERTRMIVACAYGTDFSRTLIEAANREAQQYLTTGQRSKVRFLVARNERLIEDVAASSSVDEKSLAGSFDLAFGINTIRYAHRLKNQEQCVSGIKRLLSEDGVCIIIDMNAEFPAFRSHLFSRSKNGDAGRYLPTLDEYAEPFKAAGFEILRKQNFCWVPHSAGAALTSVMKALTPTLNVLAPTRAMRSLVIARKERSRP